MKHRRNWKKPAILAALVLLGLVMVFVVLKQRATAPEPTQSNGPAPEQQTPDVVPSPETQPTPAAFNKKKYSIDSPSSIWVVVNKTRPIPADYIPNLSVPDVRLRLATSQEQMKFSTAAIPAVENMFEAARKDGVTLVFGSGYRSYALQKQFYDSYVAKDGQAAADRYSARPGTSEHQTGFSFDATSTSGACHLEICFENLPEGKWLAAHAHEYGFTLRYKNGKESVTGYQYEPWHFRYVGKELAAELRKNNQTLEEFFNLD